MSNISLETFMSNLVGIPILLHSTDIGQNLDKDIFNFRMSGQIFCKQELP